MSRVGVALAKNMKRFLDMPKHYYWGGLLFANLFVMGISMINNGYLRPQALLLYIPCLLTALYLWRKGYRAVKE